MIGKIFLSTALLISLIIILSLLFSLHSLKPSNDRVWESGYEILPHITINSDQVTVQNLRDAQFSQGKLTLTNYLTKTFDVKKLERVWFVVEPFFSPPFTSFKGVAHTYLVFDFTDQDPVTVSVEARREKGEQYDTTEGLFNKYELIYVWGSESDATTRRVLAGNKLYMYPLNISLDGAGRFFLQLAKTTQDLETNPRFYNTLTHNCTNELAQNANQIKANVIPWGIALFLPGYSDQELYKAGLIPNNLDLEEEKQNYFISDLVKRLYIQSDFSQALRDSLL